MVFRLASLFFCTPVWFAGEEKNMWEGVLVNGVLCSFLLLEI